MSASTQPKPFQVASMDNLTIGRTIKPVGTGSAGPTMMPNRGWSLPSGTYTPRQIVQGLAPLLEVVLHHLGPDPPNTPTARQMLLDNLSSNLNMGTRESSIHFPLSDAGRKEIGAQVVVIGKTLAQYAREIDSDDVHIDLKYAIRSPCEGHLLKPPVAQLMFGSRSLQHLMQIYNEYLHQMVLLRDALLPFENFEEVIIPVPGSTQKSQLGMRWTEPARGLLLSELMTKQLTQKGLYRAAISLLAPQLKDEEGYGFQYAQGIVLPSFVVGSEAYRLLAFVPSILDDRNMEMVFQNEIPDYYVAPRTEIAQPVTTLERGSSSSHSSLSIQETKIQSASISVDETAKRVGRSRLLKLRIRFADGQVIAADLGQIARGRRYAYVVRNASTNSAGLNEDAQIHSVTNVFSKTSSGSLITAEDGGIHVIPVSSNVEALAILGQLYPENIVLVGPGKALKDAEAQGKTLPDSPKFILDMRGVKGSFI